MKTFADLFRGRDDAYGTYGNTDDVATTDRGKRVARARTQRGEVTPALWAAHLAGESRLGIVPVLKNGTCWWFCIDVDFYQEHGLHEEIAGRIAELALPLVQTKSKSGGVHLWCFFSDPIPAAEARSMAESFRRKLKLPDQHIDIFPAQDKADDIGNWVNLPYFGETCHCVGETGDGDLNLEAFLEYANDRVVHRSDLKKRANDKTVAKTSDAPPCIDFMRENGVPEGHRDNCVTQFAIYANKANPDTMKEDVFEFNQENCDPPLSNPEVTKSIKAAQKNQYGYMCDKIKSLYCNKKECKLREFGIGHGQKFNHGTAEDIGIESIEKIDGEQPIYRVVLRGKRFQIGLDQLFLYNAFKKAALGAVNEFLPIIKQPDWETYMNAHLEEMLIQGAAPDTQTQDRVIKIFHQFAERCTTDPLPQALARGIAYYDGENLIFRGDDLMTNVDRQLNRLPREKTWAYMRDYGCVMQDFTIDDTKLTLWVYVPDGPLWFDPYEKDKV